MSNTSGDAVESSPAMVTPVVEFDTPDFSRLEYEFHCDESRFRCWHSIFVEIEDFTSNRLKVLEWEEQSYTEEDEVDYWNFFNYTLEKTMTSLRSKFVETFRIKKKKNRRPTNTIDDCWKLKPFRELKNNKGGVDDCGYSLIHLAAVNGQVETVRKLIEDDQFAYRRLDKHGDTALFLAARIGHVEVMKVIVDACSEAMKALTPSGQNCLHIAVSHNKERAVRLLVEWLVLQQKNESCLVSDLINGKDYGGNTPLHLAVSRKQIQTIQLLLDRNSSLSELVNVNAMTLDGFTARDILNVLPYLGKIDNDIENILHEAGALRSRDLPNHDISSYAAYDNSRKGFTTTNISTIMPYVPRKEFSNHLLLLISSLLVALTYQAAFHAPRRTSKEGYTLELKKQQSIMTRSFVLFNSTCFVGSLGVIIVLLHRFPFKPWPQISAIMLFGSYMCCIMSIAPSEAWILLSLAIPFLLLAATGKLLGLGRKMAYMDS